MSTISNFRALFQAGKHQQCLSLLNTALAEQPDNFKLLDARSACFLKLNKHRSALRDAKRQTELHPASPQGYRRAAEVYFALGDEDKARKFIQAGIQNVEQAGGDAAVLQKLSQTAVVAKPPARHHGLGLLPMELFVQVMDYLPQAQVTKASHVCRSWRQTITQDPRFWTDLSLKSDATALHKSATHLDRLGSKRLLSLSICLNKPSTVWRLEQHMRPALSDLIKLTFAVEDDRDMIRACSKVLAHAALSLQELYIISRNVVAFDLPLFPFLAALPRLTVLDVRASGIVEGPPKGRWSIPDKSHVRQRPVKHLHLERAYFGPGIFLDDAGASESDSSRQVMDNVEHLGLAIEFTPGQPFRLSDWPNLTSLQVESTQANPDWLSPSPNDPVPQVVNLQSLHITDIGNDSAWPLQEWLFPALKELRIHNGRSTSLRLSLDHLCRTSPSLEDLSLTSSIKVDDTLLHHLATKWTGLRRLNVAQSFLDGNFVTSIVNEGLLPRLESINLSACVPLRASPLIKLVQRGLQQRPENSTGSDDMPSSTFAIIQEMILLDCENLEKEGVDWLKTQVPVFRHRWADPKLLRKGQNGTRNSRAMASMR